MIEVEVDLRPGVDLLSRVRGRVERPRPLLDGIATGFMERERQLFATSGFGRWAPLAAATVRAKGNGRIMIDTGGLLRLVASQSSIRVTSSTVEVTVNHRGAYYNRIGARGTPRRDVMPPATARERKDWANTALGFLATGARP